jgi:hypothetical protein
MSEAQPAVAQTEIPSAPVVAQPEPTTPKISQAEMAEQMQQLLVEKRAANAEAKTRRLHEKELEDSLAKYKADEEAKRQAEMTELERVKAESQKFQAELAKERTERERTAREYEVSSAGVLRKYAKYVAAELAAASAEDAQEWLAAFKLENPAFFEQPKVVEKIVEKIVEVPAKTAIPQPAAPAAGGGGPPPPTSTPDVQNQIQNLVERYKTLTTGTERYRDGAGMERTEIQREHERLTGRKIRVV